MLILYCAFALMLLLSIVLISLAFFTTTQENFTFPSFTLVSIIFTLLSLTAYHYTGNSYALQQWIKHGREHYQLQVEVQRLGGIDAIIKRVQAKLEKNPDDIQGWKILGKLYLGKNDTKSAKTAFRRADALSN